MGDRIQRNIEIRTGDKSGGVVIAGDGSAGNRQARACRRRENGMSTSGFILDIERLETVVAVAENRQTIDGIARKRRRFAETENAIALDKKSSATIARRGEVRPVGQLPDVLPRVHGPDAQTQPARPHERPSNLRVRPQRQ